MLAIIARYDRPLLLTHRGVYDSIASMVIPRHEGLDWDGEGQRARDAKVAQYWALVLTTGLLRLIYVRGSWLIEFSDQYYRWWMARQLDPKHDEPNGDNFSVADQISQSTMDCTTWV